MEERGGRWMVGTGPKRVEKLERKEGQTSRAKPPVRQEGGFGVCMTE
jgi:hypothetical protein